MRKLVGVLILTLVWSVSSGQFTKKEILYGNVQTDGYQQITKGAYWAKRPEAKEIYEGRTPPKGFTGYELLSYSFLRFVEGEHNGKDNNYIVAPPGARIYTDSVGQFYSAECGNKIEFVGPVERFILMPPNPSKQDSTKAVSSIINNTTNTVNNYYNYKDTTLNESLQKLGNLKDSVKWYQTTVAGVVGGLIIGGVASYFIFKKEKTTPPKPYVPPVVPPVIPPVVEPRTMPPGIPAVPVVPTTPGLPSDPRTMPEGIPGTTPPETETPTPTTPEVPAGLPAEPRGMPGGISSIFPAGRIVTVGFTFPAPWGR